MCHGIHVSSWRKSLPASKSHARLVGRVGKLFAVHLANGGSFQNACIGVTTIAQLRNHEVRHVCRGRRRQPISAGGRRPADRPLVTVEASSMRQQVPDSNRTLVRLLNPNLAQVRVDIDVDINASLLHELHDCRGGEQL